MQARYSVTYLAVLIAIAGCYGTKVPAPERSVLGPQGNALPARRPPQLPEDLADLLAAYRTHLVAEAHHLSTKMAEHYADVETRTLASSYEGREAELRTVIGRWLSPSSVRTLPEKKQQATFPLDPRDGEGERQ